MAVTPLQANDLSTPRASEAGEISTDIPARLDRGGRRKFFNDRSSSSCQTSEPLGRRWFAPRPALVASSYP